MVAAGWFGQAAVARIFISHSSADNAEAIALRDWLFAEGWDDLFLDLDPERGIVAGERWERRLNEAANRCEAVVFLVSRAWLGSRWCLREFNLASRLNKRMFGILVEDIPMDDLPSDLTASWQIVRLAAGTDHQMMRAKLPDGDEKSVTFSKAGLRSLKTGLSKAGLDARFFAWPPEDDPQRPPYRGMRPLEAEDAGIFFGREAPVIEALDRLRGLADAAPPRFLAILGASGAGKSSFLRAGLLPRLARDDRNFLPLPVIRPERAVLSGEAGLVRSLEAASQSAGLKKSRAVVKAAVTEGGETFAALLAELAEASRAPIYGDDPRPPAPAIVLAIDQGEEMFAAEGREEADAFLELVADIVGREAPSVIVIATIRSDAYEALQTAPALEGIRQSTLSLPPMPKGAYQTVIEGPAARLRDTERALVVEPALTAALLSDVEAGGGKDSLPLLAFTLERLYIEHGGDGDLNLSEYHQLGGIRGSIEAAVERALQRADGDPAVPRDRAARLALLRRALIPWLAGVDPETNAPRRRVARLSEIPEEARPLVNHLVAERLLSTEQVFDMTGEAGAGGLVRRGEITVEPAHEALLRQWGLLDGWLQEEAGAFSVAYGVKRAAAEWEANVRAGEWLSHQAGRLEDALQLVGRSDFARFFDDVDRAYLDAARTADTERRNRELEEARKLAEAQKIAAERQKQVATRTRIGAAAAVVLALAAGALGWYGLDQASLAAIKTAEAEEGAARLAVNVAGSLVDAGQTDEPALLLLDAARSFNEENAGDKTRIAFHRVNEAIASRQMFDLPAGATAFEGPDALYFVDAAKKEVLRFDGDAAPKPLAAASPDAALIRTIGFTREGDVVIVRDDMTVERVPPAGGPAVRVGQLAKPEAKEGRVYDVYEDEEIIVHANGMVVTATSYQDPGDVYGTFIRLLDSATGAQLAQTFESSVKYLLTAGGDEYFASGGEAFRVLRDGMALRVEPATLSEDEFRNALLRTCILDGYGDPEAYAPEMYAAIDTSGSDAYGFEQYCYPYNDAFIYSSFMSGSAGVSRSDVIVKSDGTTDEIRNILTRFAGTESSGNNLAWLGTDPERYEIGAILDRDFFAFNDYSLSSRLKHPDAPTMAKYLGGGRIAIVEPWAGRIVVHELSRQGPRPALSAPDEAEVEGKQKPLDLQNPGNCTGFTVMEYFARQTRLTNGAVLDFSDLDDEDPDRVLTVTAADGTATSVDLGKPAEGTSNGCLAFSRDGTRVLIVDGDNASVALHDFTRALADGNFTASKIADLPGRVNTAQFIGADNDVLTSDYGFIVKRWRLDPAEASGWSSREVYKADRPVFYAETDASGEKLLTIEAIGGGNTQGFLYSLPTQSLWMDLGTDYKWFGAAFATDGRIVAGARGEISLIELPNLAKLVAETDSNLQRHCRPATDGDYRASACWPTGF